MTPVSVASGPNSDKAMGISIVLVVVVVIVLAVILFSKFMNFGSGALEWFNLKDTKEEKENKAKIKTQVNEEEVKGNGSAWSPNFWRAAPSGSKLFTVAVGNDIAEQFWDSVGYIWDTPSKGAGAVRRCSTKSQLSWVADRFNIEYGLDLLQWLQNKYDTGEQLEILADILRYADGLPKYT